MWLARMLYVYNVRNPAAHSREPRHEREIIEAYCLTSSAGGLYTCVSNMAYIVLCAEAIGAWREARAISGGGCVLRKVSTRWASATTGALPSSPMFATLRGIWSGQG